jgi:hypothetical protein
VRSSETGWSRWPPPSKETPSATADAEPLPVQESRGLKAREAQISPLYARYRLGEVMRRMIRLYAAWGRPEKDAEWREKLAGQGHDHSIL